MKRLLALMLALSLLVSALPTAFAEEAVLPPENCVVGALDELQAAIVAAKEGDTILVSRQIEITTPGPCEVGSTAKRITIKPDETFSDMALFYIQPAAGMEVTFCNLLLDGNSADILAVESPIEEFDPFHISFLNVEVQNFYARSWGPVTFGAGMIYIENSTFSDNCGRQAGHIFVANTATVEISQSLFHDGKSSGSGGAISNIGNLVISDCTFTKNEAGYNNDTSNQMGGAINNSGICAISNSRITGNAAQAAGGIYNSGELHLIDTLIAENTSTVCGADLYKGNATITYMGNYTWGEREPLGWYEDSIDCRFDGEANITPYHGLTADGDYTGHLRFVYADEIKQSEESPSPTPAPSISPDVPPEEGEPLPPTPPSEPPVEPSEPPTSEDTPTPSPTPSTPPEPSEMPTEPPTTPDSGSDDVEDEYPLVVPPKPTKRPPPPAESQPPIETSTVFACNGAVLDTSALVSLSGYGDGLLHEDDYMTRGQAAQLVYSLLTEASAEAIYSTENSFGDVSASTWYNEAVSTLANAGVIVGYGGNYHPEEHLTWAQILTIFARFRDTPEDVNLVHINTAHHWAAMSIHAAVAYGWIEDTPAFDLDSPITRGEAVSLINRILGT